MSKSKTTTAEPEIVEEAAEAVEEVVEEVKAPEPLMYVGPTIAGIGIQNRVYTDIPVGAQEAFKELPELRNLFIQINQYPDANKMLRERKGYIYSAFKKALTLKGGNAS